MHNSSKSFDSGFFIIFHQVHAHYTSMAYTIIL